MNAIKKAIKSGSLGKAAVIGSVYAVGAAIIKLTTDYYRENLKK